ncbi:MAG TPA: DUF4352 domain-containing protein [Candidatus Polarisedimenticolia bacterium]|nr:DUF4352 domain-containing protein [Candidatus Polarisedimenticolia bacterium]
MRRAEARQGRVIGWMLILPAALLGAAGCAAQPLEGLVIEAVELRQAPRLEFLRARVGMKFLEVRFDFENRSDDTVTLKALDFSLRDAAGTLHPFSAQVLMMGQPRGQAHIDVQPGLRLPGSVVFQIPEGSAPAELIYRYDLDGGKVISLRASG